MKRSKATGCIRTPQSGMNGLFCIYELCSSHTIGKHAKLCTWKVRQTPTANGGNGLLGSRFPHVVQLPAKGILPRVRPYPDWNLDESCTEKWRVQSPANPLGGGV